MTPAYAIGETICDEYVVRLPLGAGGMGEVYLVEHSSSGDLRAAKVMRYLDGASGTDLAGFRQEAISLLNVGNHPFTVRLFDVREQGRNTVLLMEYVAPTSGCITVRDYIVRKQGYSDRLLGAWAVQFCVGMEHALASGIATHRDIKPANLLIDSGAFLKIADFGLALAVSHHPAFVSARPKSLSHLQWLEAAEWHRTCGTPGYVAPELFFGGKASQQSDMFSFGVTLWQLAARTLASPYGVSAGDDIVAFQRAVNEKTMAHRVEPIDSPLFEVARRCMAPDPAQRYPDFPALREAIKSALKAVKIPAMDFIVASGFRGSFDDYLNRGRSYLVLGRHERALSILDKAVKHDPTSYAALVARAEALAHRGHYVEAVRDFEAARDLKPDEVAPIVGMAFAWLALDLPQKAREALDLVLADRPDSLEALLLLAHVCGTQGDDQAALKIVEKVIACDPEDWRAHEYHGRALWSLGKPADAARAFGKCLRINPLAVYARLALASVLTGQKELGRAAEEYKYAVRLFRDNPETLHRIAAHMSDGGHSEGAIELFRWLAEVVPESRSTMMVCVGNAQLRLGDAVSAADSYRKAIEADPDCALAYSRLGDIEADNRRNGKAAEYYARACELEPENWRYQGVAGTAYLQEADYGQAAAYLRRSVELFPEQPLMLYNLGVALCFQGGEEAAIQELTKAVGIDEGYARGWYFKALAEARLGRKTDAMTSVGRAIANGAALSVKELQEARGLLEQLSARTAPKTGPALQEQ